jgi:hypothetical protein
MEIQQIIDRLCEIMPQGQYCEHELSTLLESIENDDGLEEVKNNLILARKSLLNRRVNGVRAYLMLAHDHAVDALGTTLAESITEVEKGLCSPSYRLIGILKDAGAHPIYNGLYADLCHAQNAIEQARAALAKATKALEDLS